MNLIPTAYAADVINIPTIGGGLLGSPDKPELIANNILSLLTSLAYPLAFFAVLYTSYTLITSIGKPDAMQKAKDNIVMIFIGIFFIVFATTLVRLIIGFIAAGG